MLVAVVPRRWWCQLIVESSLDTGRPRLAISQTTVMPDKGIDALVPVVRVLRPEELDGSGETRLVL